jgi:hypothetical protein
MENAFKPGRAIPIVDQVMAAVSMVHEVVQRENDDNPRLGDSWLVLQLANEKLQELRDALEKADSLEPLSTPDLTGVSNA